MEISTEAAPGAVDDSDTAAENNGISEMNAHSVQKSIAEAAALELLAYVAIDTNDRACRNAGVFRLLTIKLTTDPLGGGATVPLILITRLQPVNKADAVAEEDVTVRAPCCAKLQKPDS
jgi:hypothetical protein